VQPCVEWTRCSLGLPALIASYWGDARGGFLVAGALRWFIVQHFTFFVNSVAHGEVHGATDAHAFDEGAHGIGPRMSLLVTFCSLGEGWHDYHHHFPWDYAAAELDARHQFNPTKVFIDSCYHLGLCSDRRRCLAGNQLARRSRLSRSAVSVIPKVRTTARTEAPSH
jgi:stearoyl-CoA desaturase (delta-9 desaturase)